jgi:hypothetical protein
MLPTASRIAPAHNASALLIRALEHTVACGLEGHRKRAGSEGPVRAEA